MTTRVFEALAHPVRREILALLREGGMSAGEIASRLNIPKPTLSGRLNLLKAADLIYGERRGTSIIYHLNLSVLEESMASFVNLFGIGRPSKGSDMHE